MLPALASALKKGRVTLARYLRQKMTEHAIRVEGVNSASGSTLER
jgi:hypothetical protein